MERRSRNRILREVKERLSTGNYSEIHKLRSINSTDRIITLGNKKLTEQDIFDYYEKVLSFQGDQEAELYALGYLIDDSVFNKMNGSEQQRYVLDLSKLYLSLKEECKNRL